MTDRIWYVYGVVSGPVDTRDAPAGLEESPVEVERAGDLAALVSTLDAAAYGTDPLASRGGDMDWIGPRAIAHDAVVSWASERGAVVPLPMFSMFTDGASVRAMLERRRVELEGALRRVADGREYALRVYRMDDVLLEHLETVSPRIAEQAATARSASPGQRYLLERKLEGEKKSELRRVGLDVAREIFTALDAVSMEAVAEPLPSKQGEPGAIVLNAAFLVRRGGLRGFQEALTECAARHEPHGFRFAFTGPWPPYHFVRGKTDGV